jgi:hypothetical protein
MQVASEAASQKTTAPGTPDMSATFRSFGRWQLHEVSSRSDISKVLQNGKYISFQTVYTHWIKKEIFLIYKKIQKGAVAKSYMTNGLLIDD